MCLSSAPADGTVPSEEEASTNLPYLMTIQLDCFAISTGSRPINMTDKQSNPEQNVFQDNPFCHPNAAISRLI